MVTQHTEDLDSIEIFAIFVYLYLISADNALCLFEHQKSVV